LRGKFMRANRALRAWELGSQATLDELSHLYPYTHVLSGKGAVAEPKQLFRESLKSPRHFELPSAAP